MESLSSCVRTINNLLIQKHIRPVIPITPARENYHCEFPMEADNEERHYVHAVPMEVGLCLC
jgi:hypothetical protein